MLSRAKFKPFVVAGILAAALLGAVTTGPFCLPLPADAGHVTVRCFLWLAPDAPPEAAPLAVVSLPPDWNPDK